MIELIHIHRSDNPRSILYHFKAEDKNVYITDYLDETDKVIDTVIDGEMNEETEASVFAIIDLIESNTN